MRKRARTRQRVDRAAWPIRRDLKQLGLRAVIGYLPAPAMEIFKEFRFEAAHRLPNVPPEHKCARLHGHSFVVQVHVRGTVGERSGWIVDFADIAVAWAPLHAVLDHYFLNEIAGLENPTSEILAQWIWRKLLPTLPGLSQIQVRETCTSGCVYRGEDEG